MITDPTNLIESLKKSSLIAECPHCGDEFALSNALIFDGREEFPEKAEEKKQVLLQELKDRMTELAERQKKTSARSETGAIAVGIGNIIEKILPVHKNFPLIPSDCRFLAEPIDMIVFDGVSENKIKHITFLDVKTGNASLIPHQRQIRDAVNDHQVKWRSL